MPDGPPPWKRRVRVSDARWTARWPDGEIRDGTYKIGSGSLSQIMDARAAADEQLLCDWGAILAKLEATACSEDGKVHLDAPRSPAVCPQPLPLNHKNEEALKLASFVGHARSSKLEPRIEQIGQALRCHWEATNENTEPLA